MVFLCGHSSNVSAAVLGIPSTIELDGYLWSSNIGWISLNCKTGGATANDICGTSDYRVTISVGGYLTGYAWSSSVGWILFNGLSNFPVATGVGGTVASSAQVTGTYPNLTFVGWARACAGTVNGDCSTMTSRTDGWDGWISLNGTNYQIRFNSNGTMYASSSPGGTAQDGFFWGSNVIGWITADDSMSWSAISANLTGSDCLIPHGLGTCTTTVAWSFTPTTTTANPTVDQTTLGVVTSGINLIPAAKKASSTKVVTLGYGSNLFEAKTGSFLLKSLNLNALCADSGDYSYSVASNTCKFTATTTSVTLTVTPSYLRSGEKPSISWTVSGVPDMSACALTGPQIPAYFMTAASLRVGSTTPLAGLKSYSTYSLTCGFGTSTDSAAASVEVIPTIREN